MNRPHLSIDRLFPLDHPLSSFTMPIQPKHLNVAFGQHRFFQVVHWPLSISLYDQLVLGPFRKTANR